MTGNIDRSTSEALRALVIGITMLPFLAACGSSGKTLTNPEKGQTLEFVDDSHVRYIGNYKDREWLYEAERASNGDIIEMKMRHPEVGSIKLRRNDDGCLVGDGLRFCP